MDTIGLPDPLCLTNPLFPGIGDARLLRRVLDFHLRIPAHGSIHDGQRAIADTNAHRIEHIDPLVDGSRRQVLIGAAGKTKDHGKIIRCHPVEAYRQVLAWFERNVIGRVLCRFVVGTCIDAKQRKIARMPRPHPVVRIGAKLADTGWRSPHQPDILIGLRDKQKVLVAIKKRTDQYLLPGLLAITLPE